MEGDGVKITEALKVVFDISVRVDDRGHDNHIEGHRGKACEGYRVGDVAVLAVIKCVEGQKI